jgi:hypothetical protein
VNRLPDAPAALPATVEPRAPGATRRPPAGAWRPAATQAAFEDALRGAGRDEAQGTAAATAPAPSALVMLPAAPLAEGLAGTAQSRPAAASASASASASATVGRAGAAGAASAPGAPGAAGPAGAGSAMNAPAPAAPQDGPRLAGSAAVTEPGGTGAAAGAQATDGIGGAASCPGADGVHGTRHSGVSTAGGDIAGIGDISDIGDRDTSVEAAGAAIPVPAWPAAPVAVADAPPTPSGPATAGGGAAATAFANADRASGPPATALAATSSLSAHNGPAVWQLELPATGGLPASTLSVERLADGQLVVNMPLATQAQGTQQSRAVAQLQRRLEGKGVRLVERPSAVGEAGGADHPLDRGDDAAPGRTTSGGSGR